MLDERKIDLANFLTELYWHLDLCGFAFMEFNLTALDIGVYGIIGI